MQDEEANQREHVIELDVASDANEAPPIRVAPDDLAPDTLRAVVEAFVLREGTDYGRHETSLDDKVDRVMTQLLRGEAHIVFEPSSQTVTIVITRTLDGSMLRRSP